MAKKPNKLEVTIYPKAIALTIGGSDPSGGAGIQADLKTFQQLGVFGTSAITLLTVQNTLRVSKVQVLDPRFVLEQIDAVVSDMEPVVAKTGALGNAEMVDAVADRAKELSIPIVVDPVMISKHGDKLIEEDAIELIRTKLIPNAYMLTPNRHEAERLTGLTLDNEDNVAKAIHDMHVMGAKFVLLKLGKVDGVSLNIFGDGDQNTAISLPWLKTQNTHGSGCVLSAAITGRLARGEHVKSAANNAVGDVWKAIKGGRPLGQGFHPVEFQFVGVEN